MKPCIFLLSAALLTSGCTLGPNYQRPTVAVPGSYRGTISDEAAQTQLAAAWGPKVVGHLPGRAVAHADPHGAYAKL